MSLVQQNIIRIIDEKCLMKKGVARRAGISQQALSDIIAGRKVIRADIIPPLANALGVDVDELFKDAEKGA